MLISSGICENDILVGSENMPALYYDDDGICRRYYPDILISSTNTIIEVKSTYTIQDSVNMNLLKQKCSQNYGYNFEFWIVTPTYEKTIVLDLKQYLKEVK